MDDRKLVQLIVAENNEGKRGLFQIDTTKWIRKGDLLWSVGKFWEVINTVNTFDDNDTYSFIMTCCDLYEVTGAKIDAYYNKRFIEE